MMGSIFNEPKLSTICYESTPISPPIYEGELLSRLSIKGQIHTFQHLSIHTDHLIHSKTPSYLRHTSQNTHLYRISVPGHPLQTTPPFLESDYQIVLTGPDNQISIFTRGIYHHAYIIHILSTVCICTDLHYRYSVLSLLGKGAFGSVYKTTRSLPVYFNNGVKEGKSNYSPGENGLEDFQARYEGLVEKEKGKFYAVKSVSKKGMRENEKLLVSVYNEAHILRMLNRPGLGFGSNNLLKLYEIHETVNSVYMVFEYIEGLDLHEYLQREVKMRDMEEKEVLNIFVGFVRGMSLLHSLKIFHKDIKPSNIMIRIKKRQKEETDTEKKGSLNENGNGLEVWKKISPDDVVVIDFGLSVYNHPNNYQQNSGRCGTPGYMAPEFLGNRLHKENGLQTVSEAADVYSAGIVLFTMLVGKNPFYKKNETVEIILDRNRKNKIHFPSSIYARFSSSLVDFCKRMLETDARLRPASTEALSNLLKLLNEGCQADSLQRYGEICDIGSLDDIPGISEKISVYNNEDNPYKTITSVIRNNEKTSGIRCYNTMSSGPKSGRDKGLLLVGERKRYNYTVHKQEVCISMNGLLADDCVSVDTEARPIVMNGSAVSDALSASMSDGEHSHTFIANNYEVLTKNGYLSPEIKRKQSKGQHGEDRMGEERDKIRLNVLNKYI